MRRRVKQVPLAFYSATPASLFSESDFPGWTFQNEVAEEKNTDNHESGYTTTTDAIHREHSEQQYAKRQRVDCT